ncbi:hypothetical protein [Flavobacterium sedimenticola]|uniref:TonB-dependent receptor plug domain-containing protein n=1 Tax=Flavobacterium sedimenticola TaxID=3043286 RepID=A0ABT6XMI6_9FLAO|nr:hypothetical protein [Flavobacterium sedimenticola]MDI9256302.1 hypothetical protein [Flavobacterium sedimenticola]
MKKLFALLLLLKLTYNNAQSKGFNANEDQFLTKLDSVSNGIVEPGYAIYINDYKVTEEDKEWLALAGKGDFISIKVLSKKEAMAKFGADGEKGAVLLTPFTDELLDMKYYNGITNMFVLGKMVDMMAAKQIGANPVFVVDGKPLRGDSIVTIVNALKEEEISRLTVLKKKAAFSIYGIRALPGVILIFTKEYEEKHQKK